MTDSGRLERRVVEAAQAALDEHAAVDATDVLGRLGWLPAPREDEWRQGRVEHLEDVMEVGPAKLSAAMGLLADWAQRRDLRPCPIRHVARRRDRRPLRFSRSGDPGVERAYSICWVSPDLSDRERERLVERRSRPADLVVVSPLKEWACAGCGGAGDLLFMEDPGPLCMGCAGFEHLVFLPAGDAALTRRAKRASGLSAVVVRFSRSRQRYERQGILVEPAALAEAEGRGRNRRTVATSAKSVCESVVRE